MKQWVLTDGKKLFWNTAFDAVIDNGNGPEKVTTPALTKPRFKGDHYWTLTPARKQA